MNDNDYIDMPVTITMRVNNSDEAKIVLSELTKAYKTIKERLNPYGSHCMTLDKVTINDEDCKWHFSHNKYENY